MATWHESTISQGTAEIRKWTADFTDDLPTGITVSGGSAVHTPPSGAALTPAIETTTTTVTAKLSNPTVQGQHYLDVRGTFSNGEVSQVVIAFQVTAPPTAARAGMLDLITDLRMMTDAGANDFTVAGQPYWSDAQLQTILDRYRMDFYEEDLYSIQETVNGSAVYTKYQSSYQNLEGVASGTSIFNLSDAAGTNIGSSSWTADYRRGLVTFTADRGGTSYLLTGRSYDLNRAAADVWRAKASKGAAMYDFSTDRQSFKRAQYMQHCLEMASHYAGMAGPSVTTLYRSDCSTGSNYE